MPPNRTSRSFIEELPDLLAERQLSQRQLALKVGVGDDHLSRVLRGDRRKRATPSLVRKVAEALNLPEDYFLEARLDYVVENLTDDPALLDKTYDAMRQNELKRLASMAAIRQLGKAKAKPRRRTTS